MIINLMVVIYTSSSYYYVFLVQPWIEAMRFHIVALQGDVKFPMFGFAHFGNVPKLRYQSA